MLTSLHTSHFTDTIPSHIRFSSLPTMNEETSLAYRGQLELAIVPG